MKKNDDVTGFHFQEIPLSEALVVVQAGDGIYSELKQSLLEKLPALAADKAFAFGLPKGKEFPEDQRRGLCIVVNKTLRKSSIGWRVTYSGTRQLFICVPRSLPKSPGSSNGDIPKSKWGRDPDKDAEVFKLFATGMKPREIAEVIKMRIGRVKYLCYHKAANERKALSPVTSGPMSAAQLVALAKNVFNYAGDFHDKAARKFRAPICVVGLRDLGFKARELAPLIGISGSGANFNSHYPPNQHSELTEQLRKAV